MNRAIYVLGFMLSATSAWATGINSFTVAGTVNSVHCFEFLETPTLSCIVELQAPDKNITQVICSDPMTAGACRWLEDGDTVLILGYEKSSAKQATHVALLLHEIPGAAREEKSQSEDEQLQRLRELKDAAAALEDPPDR